MINRPFVSVVIPAYNAQSTLTKAIDSVLNQSFNELECIIVNDGSTDRTDEVVSSYYDNRIVYYTQANLERSIARNSGITRARGKYIAFLDADDWWEVDKLEKQVKVFEKNPSLGLVYCDVYYVNDTTGRIHFRYGQRYRLHQGIISDRLLFQGNFIQSPTPLVSRTVFQQVGYFDPGMPPLEDWEMWLRVAERYPVGLVPEPLAYYRFRSDSTSLAKPSERLYRSHLKILQRYESISHKVQPDRSDAVRKREAVVHYTYAVALIHQHRYEDAALCLQEARKLNPVYALIYPRLVQLGLMQKLDLRYGTRV